MLYLLFPVAKLFTTAVTLPQCILILFTVLIPINIFPLRWNVQKDLKLRSLEVTGNTPALLVSLRKVLADKVLVGFVNKPKNKQATYLLLRFQVQHDDNYLLHLKILLISIALLIHFTKL